MARQGLLIGEVAAQSGMSRKAIRLYEAAGILLPPSRTPAGYRVYGSEALAVLGFVRQAKRLGFRVAEIQEIVAIRRGGQLPCFSREEADRIQGEGAGADATAAPVASSVVAR